MDDDRAARLRRRTREWLAAVDRDRAIHGLSGEGRTAAEIAGIVGVPEPQVSRILAAGPRGVSPDEIITRAFVDGTPRDDLVAALSAMSFTDGRLAEGSYDGYQPGTVDALSVAVLTGMLSQEEFDQVLAATDRREAGQR